MDWARALRLQDSHQVHPTISGRTARLSILSTQCRRCSLDWCVPVFHGPPSPRYFLQRLGAKSRRLADTTLLFKYVSHHLFSHTPPYGWAPFGYMRPEDVELEIRGHLTCSHQWRYSHWSWSFSKKINTGLSSRSMRTHHLDEERITADKKDVKMADDKLMLQISRAATKPIFEWCCDQVEEGFGGTIVPRRREPDLALENNERYEPKDGLHSSMA
ncbi:hypothetical protein BFJ63_vAg16204 [Fusarium oxysporum f. sp. narcissi]|uniref:Uncharacterized protein n=1 Tax=Fusarium oxysporum f. sp. narcissi TaxID=451672 RepID=A0A4Q2V7B4_FUSOX|nr:hypothetical protein BFJ63_vAg16204 [Fusarium oxysporum f. sp. narcissi]